MTKVKNASARAGGRTGPSAEKTARPPRANVADASGPTLISRNDSIAEKTRARKVRNGDIAEVARKYAARAVERIAEIMESDNNREALAAAFHLLDRAYGKPAGLADEKNNMNEVMLGLRESLRAKLARITE